MGAVPLTFVHTPGHTPGSQCFLVDGCLISGDTLFIRSCGRTDLPGSDPEEMYTSLTQRLGALPDDTVVLPGHNYGGIADHHRGREAREPDDALRVHERVPGGHGRRPGRPHLAPLRLAQRSDIPPSTKSTCPVT